MIIIAKLNLILPNTTANIKLNFITIEYKIIRYILRITKMKFFSLTHIVFSVIFINVSYASDEVKLGDSETYIQTSSFVLKNSKNKSISKSVWAPIIMDNIVTFVPAVLQEVPPLDSVTKLAYLNVINTARGETQDCGIQGIKPAVAALTWSDELYIAALQHSNDLAKTNTFSHTGSGEDTDIAAQALHPGIGSSQEERIVHNGYTSWLAYGENIAAGTVMDQAQEAVDAWMGSPGHCANIMNPIFTEVGMAHIYDVDSYYTNYWTQDFGKR